MSYLLPFLSIVLSLISACTMSYVSMAVETAPWVAPVVAITFMVILLKIIQKKWFKEHVVIGIAAGSLGGMVGMCIGLTWPSLYFLHPDMFTDWMASPLKFSGMISLIVLVAGSLAFVITHFLRYHLIVQHEMNFPMSVLVHNIVYMDKKIKGFAMMLNGLVVASSWNTFTWIARLSLKGYGNQLHSIPAFLSIGFVAGQAITIPLLIGMFSRVFVLQAVQQRFFYFEKQHGFILTFASGMLFAVVFMMLLSMIKDIVQGVHTHKQSHVMNLFQKFWYNIYYRVMFFTCLGASVGLLVWWKVGLLEQFYIFLALFVLCHVVATIVAEVGVLDVQSFVSFIILPLTYFSPISSIASLVLVTFCTLCLGVVIDLLFSYKISHLAKITHSKLLKYQLLGFVVAACSIGFVLWWYIHEFKLGSSTLLAQQALDQESFITFGNYNYQVLAAGFAYSAFMYMICPDMLVVIGGFMMPVSMSFWLILAGGFSYLFKSRRHYYPFWFGVYASHALWMFARALLLQI